MQPRTDFILLYFGYKSSCGIGKRYIFTVLAQFGLLHAVSVGCGVCLCVYICVYVYIVRQACHAAVQWLSDKYSKVGSQAAPVSWQALRGRVSTWSSQCMHSGKLTHCVQKVLVPESTAETSLASGFSRIGQEVAATNTAILGGSVMSL